MVRGGLACGVVIAMEGGHDRDTFMALGPPASFYDSVLLSHT